MKISLSISEQLCAVQLILPVSGKDRNTAIGHHTHPVGGLEPQAESVSPEQDTPDGSPVILEGKIVVARGIFFIV